MMLTPQLPSNEFQRLNTLYDYDILDTAPEDDFDEITKTAGFVCNMPIAMISLVDKDRLWFKSKVGLPVSQTHRSFGYCAYALLQPKKALVVSGANQTFALDSDETNLINIGFYAGAPLVAPSGDALGTLCVIDRRSRLLNEEQYKALKVLARSVTALLELRRLSRKMDEVSRTSEPEVENWQNVKMQNGQSFQTVRKTEKTLYGVLPICANCKCIRDEYGHWHEVEQYIQERSEASFTGSVCRSCSRVLYPKTYAGLDSGEASAS